MRKKKPRIVRKRKADKNNQVVTVVGGDGDYMRRPCEQCPFRIDQTGKFPAKAFEHSAETAYDMSDHVFACHMTGSEQPKTCAGFSLVAAYHNLRYRLSVISGKIKPEEISNGGIELHESYRAMAVANGVSPDSPVLRPCRD